MRETGWRSACPETVLVSVLSRCEKGVGPNARPEAERESWWAEDEARAVIGRCGEEESILVIVAASPRSTHVSPNPVRTVGRCPWLGAWAGLRSRGYNSRPAQLPSAAVPRIQFRHRAWQMLGSAPPNCDSLQLQGPHGMTTAKSAERTFISSIRSTRDTTSRQSRQ